MNRQGFTLLETLIVLAIIAILSGIFAMSLIRSIRTAELREATNQVASDFRRARSLAQRGSTDQMIDWGTTATTTTYTLAGQSRTIANNITLQCIMNCGSGTTANKLTYTAPYGETSNLIGSVFRLSSPRSDITPVEVRVVGLTGKVIVVGGGS